jgi:aarF domain-containing kinase
MSQELGSNWQSLFSEFERTPIASASIGQVHRATLASDGSPVAVKIQFPGIANSISSDLSYLTPLLRSSAVLPKGLYLQNTIAVMRRELADECDYKREADAGQRFRDYLEGDAFFDVPKVFPDATTDKILTTEWIAGKPLSKMTGMSQETRDKVGRPPKPTTIYVSSLTSQDRHQCPASLSAGALPFPIYADRPKLGQLPVRPGPRSAGAH